jgi:hypothetical protein
MHCFQKRFLQLGRIQPIKQPVKNIKKPLISQKWKKRGQEIGYGAVVFGGICIAGAMVWALVPELFGRNDAEELYEDASMRVMSSEIATKYLGYPIQCSVGPLGTNRNRLISGTNYAGGKKHLIVQFFATGRNGSAIVTADARKLNSKYILETVEMDFNGSRIVLQDSRLKPKKGRFGFT